MPRPDDIAQPQVARQRVGNLRRKKQQDDAEHTRQQGSARARYANQRHAGYDSSRQPRHDHPTERLEIETGKLQQRQGITDARTDREPAQPAQYVQPTEAGEQPRE